MAIIGPQAQIQVLVVEDDAAVRDSLGAYLETLGYSVAYASDGKSALEQIALRVPEVVVTDLLMPGMDGIEFMSVLPSWESAIPVIAISGGDPRLLDMARRLGAAAAFAKPIAGDELAFAVARCAMRSFRH